MDGVVFLMKAEEKEPIFWIAVANVNIIAIRKVLIHIFPLKGCLRHTPNEIIVLEAITLLLVALSITRNHLGEVRDILVHSSAEAVVKGE